MNSSMTFQDWLLESPNDEPDKILNLQYIEKLHQNIGIAFDYQNVPAWKDFLSNVDTPYGEIEIDTEKMVGLFRTLSNNLDELKSEERYTKVFGAGFGRPYEKHDEAKKTYFRVGDCKTALDQFARFLRGVESSLAQHAALTRHHYETKYQLQPKLGTDTLVLPNDWKEMKTLINDYQSMQTAMNKDTFKNKHGLDDVRYRSGMFEFTFK